MILIDTALRRREQEGRPVRIGVIGAGAMARPTVALITNQVPGMVVDQPPLERLLELDRALEGPP